MKKLQPLPKLSRKQKSSQVGGIVTTGLVNVFHFSLEFSILERVGLPYIFIIFHMIGVSFGTIISIKLTTKMNRRNLSSIFFVLFIFI